MKLLKLIIILTLFLLGNMLSFFLVIPWIRYQLAYWIIKYIEFRDYDPYVTELVPNLISWLQENKQINYSELRCLILIVFLHLYKELVIYDIEFMTGFSPRLFSNDMRWIYWPELFLFPIYNSLSGNEPVKNNLEYEEQMGGIAPLNIDIKRRLFDFVKGHFQLYVESRVPKKQYLEGQIVEINITIKIYQISS